MTEDEKWIVGVVLTLLGIFIGYAARAYALGLQIGCGIGGAQHARAGAWVGCHHAAV